MLAEALLSSIVFLFTAPSIKRYERNELNYLAGVGFAAYFWVHWVLNCFLIYLANLKAKKSKRVQRMLASESLIVGKIYKNTAASFAVR